nr:hypothetical protein [Tanacetum cinerariifolium]
MSTPTFAKTHNLIAYLEKPTECDGFEQIIDFRNGSSIKYALTVDDEVWIQALVDEKRVNIKESSIRRTLRLDDAEGTSCLTNAEIFEGLARMGCEKPSDKLTFYKAFLSPQWKFLIHTILQCLSAKTTSWNEFSSTIASAIICLGTRFSGEVTPLFANMLVQATEEVERIEKLESRIERLKEENSVLKELMGVHSKVDYDEPIIEKEKSFKQGRKIAYIDADVEINLEKAQAEAYNLDLDHQEKDDVTAASVKVPKPRKRKGVIIQDPEETTTTVTVQPKQVQRREKLTDAITKYQALKRKPLTEVQARRNMIVYLKNMAGYKMNYFKGMTYDEIRPLFEKHYNYNQAFLNEVNEGVKVPKKEVSKQVKVECSKREGESLEPEIAKKQKMEQETEELKKNLQIVLDDDDNVYTDTTPLASKIPIVDYKIHTERNIHYFKIIKAYGNHMLFLSFSIMLKNFDREDLESLWNIPNVEANVLKDQKGKYGLAKVKRWKLFKSCGVHCLTLLTTNIFLLIERMYPLTHFTLEQMMNDVKLEVEDESEMSVELLRLVRRQLNEGYVPQ